MKHLKGPDILTELQQQMGMDLRDRPTLLVRTNNARNPAYRGGEIWAPVQVEGMTYVLGKDDKPEHIRAAFRFATSKNPAGMSATVFSQIPEPPTVRVIQELWVA